MSTWLMQSDNSYDGRILNLIIMRKCSLEAVEGYSIKCYSTLLKILVNEKNLSGEIFSIRWSKYYK